MASTAESTASPRGLPGGRPPSTPPAATAGADADESRQVRGKALVAKVLAATITELARVGYENLAIEQVAEVASVNKTTIYRRWATKRDLTQAALGQVADAIPEPPDTGSLRRDLLGQMQMFRSLTQQPGIMGLMRMLCGGQLHDDIAQYADSIRQSKEQESFVIYTRAIERGELPRGVDVWLINAVIGGAVQNLVLFEHDSCDDRRLEQIIDLVLDGARSRAPGPARGRTTR